MANEKDEHLFNTLHEAAYHLNDHGVVAFPTETVMGLGVVYDDEFAYNRLNIIKQRPEDKPYTLMVESKEQIHLFAEINPRDQKIINALLPGPLTLLLKPKEGVPHWVTHGGPTIGIRVSSHPLTQSLLSFTGKPLLVPSANKSGEKPAMNSTEVRKIFGNSLDYIVSGHAEGGVPSTIIDLTGEEIKMVRQGPITMEMIKHVLNNKIAVGCDHGGFEYKEKIKEYLLEQGYEVVDCGTFSKDSCHYPIFASEVAKNVASGNAKFGILVCTSGEGVCMVANKVKGCRCGIGYNDEVARLMREHNNANVIAFGQGFMDLNEVIRRIDIFLNSEFQGGRHQTRVDMFENYYK